MTDEHSAPPMSPADEFDGDFALKPKWPKVIGIISIVWASIGLVCGGLGTVFLFLTPMFMRQLETQGQGGVPPQMLTVNMLQAVLSVISVLWVVFLLIAGIMLVSRNPKARMLHIVYAVGGLVLSLVGTYYGLDQQAQINEWVAQNPDATFSQQHSPTGNMIGMVFVLTLGVIWPLFLLFWFLAIKRDPNAIAEGVEELVA